MHTFLMMHDPFSPWLDTGRTVILDGGLGTELERRGHRELGRLWSSALVKTNPTALREVHREFLLAGANVIATATYQAAMPTLLDCGHDRESATLVLRDAVALALGERDAHAPDALVAASIGPFGAHLADGSEYTGRHSMTVDELFDFQSARWHILAESAADIIACETMPSLPDVLACARLLRETPWLRAWISLMCGDADHLADGTSLAEVLAILNDVPNLAAVGANCIPPKLAPAIMDTFRHATSLPLIVYPNASNTWNTEAGSPAEELSPEEFAAESQMWRSHGASIVGGCCKTTPAHIRALSERQRPSM